MPTLYVVEPGAQIEKEYHRLLVTKEDEVILRVPLQQVSQVVLVGPVGVTTPALYALLAAQVPVLLVRRTGRLAGRLLPVTPRNLPLRQAQYRRNEDKEFALQMAKAIVLGKLRNQRVVALRVLRNRALSDQTHMEILYDAEAKAQRASDMEALLGLEGKGARAYFAIYQQAFDPSWGFQRRTRRPPQDPVNALLSLGYALLGQTLMTALEAAGLDPYLGFFHGEKYGRPALALDLLEEFRAPFVDSLVMSVLNRRLLKRNDFGHSEGRGVYLHQRGLKVFLREFGDRLESPVKPLGLGRALSYRKVFEVQARRMAKAVLGEAALYEPFRAR